MPATILLDADAVRCRSPGSAVEIDRDHPKGVVLVGVLKGTLIFVADLARAITGVPVELDFISISRFTPDSGRVKILHDLDSDISGRDVVVVEDIVDTGLTYAYLMGQLAEQQPRSLSACTLLDRPSRELFPMTCGTAAWCWTTSSCSATGSRARPRPVSQPPIRRGGDRGIVAETPEAYVGQLYGNRAGIAGKDSSGPVVA